MSELPGAKLSNGPTLEIGNKNFSVKKRTYAIVGMVTCQCPLKMTFDSGWSLVIGWGKSSSLL